MKIGKKKRRFGSRSKHEYNVLSYWEVFDCPVCGSQNKTQIRLVDTIVKPGVIADLQKKRYADHHPNNAPKKSASWENITCPQKVQMYSDGEVYQTNTVPAVNPFVDSTDIIEARAYEAFGVVKRLGGQILIKDTGGEYRTRNGDIHCKIVIENNTPNPLTTHTYSQSGDTMAIAVALAYDKYLSDCNTTKEEDNDVHPDH